jgi:hypothetical protein
MMVLLVNKVFRLWNKEKLYHRKKKEELLDFYRQELEQVISDFHHQGLIPRMQRIVGILSIIEREFKQYDDDEYINKAWHEAEEMLNYLRLNIRRVYKNIDDIYLLIKYVKQRGAPTAPND